MAEASKSLTRIYDLRVLGGDAVIKSIKGINDALAENAKLKAIANKNAASASDLAEIEKYKARVKELTIEELKLKAAQKEAQNEKRALSTATTEAAVAAKKEKDSLVILEGSYKDIVAQMRILRPLIQNANTGSQISIGGQNLNFSQAISEYKKLSAAEQDFRRQFTKDNTLVGEYTSGIVQAFKNSGLDSLIKDQVKKANTELRGLDENFDLLKKELSNIKVTGQGSFEAVEKEMIQNRNEANKLRASLTNIEAEMRSVGGVGAQLTGELKKGFASVRSTLGGVVAGYIGFQAALSKGSELVNNAKDISDIVTDLEQNMGLATGAADGLVKKLGEINTRTSLKGLVEIADIALKAGVSNENLLGVTEAVDKVKVAFGKDFGSVEEGTETFAKLIAIFYEDGEITGERILTIGNAIRAIANETSASVPFITDFNGRMAGLKQLFENFQLSESIGLAAGFEQFKQSSEVASTVLVKVLPKLAADTEKYGKIVGLTAKEFGELINNNPTEALIRVSEALVKNGKGVEEISAALADSDLGSGRITTILATLGGKADVFRERIARAGDTINSTGAITDAFAAKNTNLAGTLDKLSKKISDAANNEGFKNFLVLAGSLLAAIIGLPFPYLIGVMTIVLGLTNATFAAKLELLSVYVLEKAAQLALATVIAFTNGYYAARNLLLTIYTAAAYRSAYASGIAATAYRAMAAAALLIASPIGIVVGLIVLFTTAVGIMSAKATDGNLAVNKLGLSFRELAAQQRINADLSERVAQATGSIASRVRTLTGIVGDLNVSEKVRRDALNQLIAISPKYREALNGEKIDIDKVRAASDELILSLQKQARVKAVADLTAEKEKRAFELESKIAGSYQDIKDASGNVIGREVRNKDNSFVGALKSLFTDNEVATLNKQEKELQDIQDELKVIYKTASENKDIQEAILNNDKTTDTTITDKDKKKKEKKTATPKSGTELLKQEYEAEKKVLETQLNDKKITEEVYNAELLREATLYRDKKLALIKAKNQEEKQQQADFIQELSKDQASANKKLFDLSAEALKIQLDAAVKNAQDIQNAVDDNPTSTGPERLKAKLNFLAAEFSAQSTFDKSMIALESKYNVDSIATASKRKEELEKIEREIHRTAYELAVAAYNEQIKLQEEAATRQQNETKTNAAQRTIDVLNDPNRSTRSRANEIKRIELEETKNLLAQEVAANRIAFEEKKKALEDGLATETQVSEAKRKLKESELALTKFTADNETSLINKITSGLKTAYDNITGFFRGIKATNEEIQGAIAEAKNIVGNAIQQAKQNYFDNQRQEVDDVLAITKQRLDLEQQQLQNTASTEAEKEAIRRRFDDKRKQAEKEAGEEKRKIALKQVSIDFAVAVVKTLAAYPFPFSLIPVAGLTIAYALQRAQINKQKFARGGYVPKRTGGQIEGPSHDDGGVPFNYEAEGGELAIINKRTAAMNKVVTATGTPREILSAMNVMGGGVAFARGATINQRIYHSTGNVQKLEYGGLLGANLQAPRDLSFLNGNNTTDDTIRLQSSIRDQQRMIVSQSQAISDMNRKLATIKVHVVAREVKTVNDEQAITAEVGTIK